MAQQLDFGSASTDPLPDNVTMLDTKTTEHFICAICMGPGPSREKKNRSGMGCPTDAGVRKTK